MTVVLAGFVASFWTYQIYRKQENGVNMPYQDGLVAVVPFTTIGRKFAGASNVSGWRKTGRGTCDRTGVG